MSSPFTVADPTPVEEVSGDEAARSRPHRFVTAAHAFYRYQVPIIALSIGAVLRIQQFLFRRSLWLDEALLAVNIVGRSYRELLEPLDIQQAAPVGFLWIQRFSITAFGNNEYALRLFPLLCGLASLGLFYRLARRVLTPKAVPIAMILFALSPLVVYYSNEAKQYSSDVLAALLILNAGHGLMRAAHVSARNVAGFGLLGVVLVWVSHPAVLVLAGVGSTVALTHILRRRWREVAGLGAVYLAWGASFAAAWRFAKRSVDAHPAFLDYWRAGFPPEGGSLTALPGWLGDRALDVMESPLGISFTALGLVLCGLGAASLVRRKRGLDLLLLSAPVPFLVGASLLRLYPIMWRLVLFLVPLFILLLVSSIDWEVRRRPRLALLILLVPLTIVSVAPVRTAGKTFVHPTTTNEARTVFQYVDRHWRPGDQLYIHDAAGAAYMYYGPVFELKAAGVVVGRNDVPCDPAKRLAALKRATRVWLVFAHRLSTKPANERDIIRSFVAVVARPVAGIEVPGAAAYLYDPHAPPGDPAGKSLITDPSTLCVRILAD